MNFFNAKKIIALGMALIFMWTNFFCSILPAYAQMPTQFRSSSLDLATFSLPSALGKIQEAYEPQTAIQNLPDFAGRGAGEAAPLVIYIQDAHTVYEAQKNIRGIIAYLQESYAVPLVGVEGAVGPLDPVLFRTFPVEEVKQKVFDSLMRKGEISGVDASAILNRRWSDFVGVENKKLYLENKEAYLEAVKVRPQADLELSGRILANREEKRKTYSPELLELDRRLQDFKEDSEGLLDFLDWISQFEISVKDYPHLHSLLQELQWDRESEAHEKEHGDVDLMKLARTIKAKLNQEEIAQYQLQHKAFRREGKRRAFVEFLQKKAREEKIDLRPYKAFFLREGRRDKLGRLAGDEFFKELHAFIESRKNSLFRSEEERRLDKEAHELQLLKKLIALELTREEFREIQHFSSHRTRRGSHQVRAPAGDAKKVPAEALSSFGMRSDLLEPALRFYELALARDQALFENLVREIKTRRVSSAAIITGGFHEEGIKALLKEKGYSYLVITPEIREIGENPYLEVMVGEDLSYKEFLNPPVSSAQTSQIAPMDLLSPGITGDEVRRAIDRAWTRMMIEEGMRTGATPLLGVLLRLWEEAIRKFIVESRWENDSGEYSAVLREAQKALAHLSPLDPVQQETVRKAAGLLQDFIKQRFNPAQLFQAYENFFHHLRSLQEEGLSVEAAVRQALKSLGYEVPAPDRPVFPELVQPAGAIDALYQRLVRTTALETVVEQVVQKVQETPASLRQIQRTIEALVEPNRLASPEVGRVEPTRATTDVLRDQLEEAVQLAVPEASKPVREAVLRHLIEKRVISAEPPTPDVATPATSPPSRAETRVPSGKESVKAFEAAGILASLIAIIKKSQPDYQFVSKLGSGSFSDVYLFEKPKGEQRALRVGGGAFDMGDPAHISIAKDNLANSIRFVRAVSETTTYVPKIYGILYTAWEGNQEVINWSESMDNEDNVKNTIGIWLEFVKGPTPREAIDRGLVKEDDILSQFDKMDQYFWKKGWLLWDFRPDNFRVAKKGKQWKLVLVDIGSTAPLSRNVSRKASERKNNFRTMVLDGKKPFSRAEVRIEKPPDVELPEEKKGEAERYDLGEIPSEGEFWLQNGKQKRFVLDLIKRDSSTWIIFADMMKLHLRDIFYGRKAADFFIEEAVRTVWKVVVRYGGAAYRISDRADEVAIALPGENSAEEVESILKEVQKEIKELFDNHFGFAQLITDLNDEEMNRSFVSLVAQGSVKAIEKLPYLARNTSGQVITKEAFSVLFKREEKESAEKALERIFREAGITDISGRLTEIKAPYLPAGAVRVKKESEDDGLEKRLQLSLAEAGKYQSTAKEQGIIHGIEGKIMLKTKDEKRSLFRQEEEKEIAQEIQNLRNQLEKVAENLRNRIQDQKQKDQITIEENFPSFKRRGLYSILSEILKDTSEGFKTYIIRGPPDNFYLLLSQKGAWRLTLIKPVIVAGDSALEESFKEILARSGRKPREEGKFGFKVINEHFGHYAGDQLIRLMNLALFQNFDSPGHLLESMEILSPLHQAKLAIDQKVASKGFGVEFDATTLASDDFLSPAQAGQVLAFLETLGEVRESPQVEHNSQYPGVHVKVYQNNRDRWEAIKDEVLTAKAHQRKRAWEELMSAQEKIEKSLHASQTEAGSTLSGSKETLEKLAELKKEAKTILRTSLLNEDTLSKLNLMYRKALNGLRLRVAGEGGKEVYLQWNSLDFDMVVKEKERITQAGSVSFNFILRDGKLAVEVGRYIVPKYRGQGYGSVFAQVVSSVPDSTILVQTITNGRTLSKFTKALPTDLQNEAKEYLQQLKKENPNPPTGPEFYRLQWMKKLAEIYNTRPELKPADTSELLKHNPNGKFAILYGDDIRLVITDNESLELHTRKVASSPTRAEVRSTRPAASLRTSTLSGSRRAEVRRVEKKLYQEATRFLFSLRRLERVSEAEKTEVEQAGYQALIDIVRDGRLEEFKAQFIRQLKERIEAAQNGMSEEELRQAVFEIMPDFSVEVLRERLAGLGITFDTPQQTEKLSSDLIKALGELNIAADQALMVTRTAEKGMQGLSAEENRPFVKPAIEKVTQTLLSKIVTGGDRTRIRVLLRIDAIDPGQLPHLIKSFSVDRIGIVNGEAVIYLNSRHPQHIELRQKYEKEFKSLRREGIRFSYKFDSYSDWFQGMANIVIAYRGALSKGYGAIAITPEMIEKKVNQALNDPSRIPEEFRALMNTVMAALAVKLGQIRDPKSPEGKALIDKLRQDLGEFGINIQEGPLGNFVVSWSLQVLIRRIQTEVEGLRAQKVAA